MTFYLLVLLAVISPAFGTNLVLPGFVNSLQIKKTPLGVTPVIISCDASVNNSNQIEDLRLVKILPEGVTYVALVNSILGVQTNFLISLDLGAKGEVGPKSHLEVTFTNIPEEDVFGTYQCVLSHAGFGPVTLTSTDAMEVGGVKELMAKIRELSGKGGNTSAAGSSAGSSAASGNAGGVSATATAGSGSASGAGSSGSTAGPRPGQTRDLPRGQPAAASQPASTAAAQATARTATASTATQTSAQTPGGTGVPQSVIDDLLARIKNLTTVVTTLEQTSTITTEINSRISALNESVNKVQSTEETTSAFNEQVSSLSSQLTTIEASAINTTKLEHDVDELIQHVATLQISALSFQGINRQLVAIAQQATNLEGSRNATNVTAWITNLSDQVNGIQYSLASNRSTCHLRSLVWPRGQYTFLKPRTGCPRNGLVAWRQGNRTHWTETSSGSNQNDNSTADHMPLNLFAVTNGNFVANLQFCTHFTMAPGVSTWPRGSFCFHRMGNRCPSRAFTTGALMIDDENGPRVNARSGTVPSGRYNSDTTYNFCCRSDGPAEEEIYLPTDEPFYMYRKGGSCQKVYGMNVTNDYIVLDTSNGSGNRPNRDRSTGTVPDGRLNNLRLELCYYEKWV